MINNLIKAVDLYTYLLSNSISVFAPGQFLEIAHTFSMVLIVHISQNWTLFSAGITQKKKDDHQTPFGCDNFECDEWKTIFISCDESIGTEKTKINVVKFEENLWRKLANMVFGFGS